MSLLQKFYELARRNTDANRQYQEADFIAKYNTPVSIGQQGLYTDPYTVRYPVNWEGKTVAISDPNYRKEIQASHDENEVERKIRQWQLMEAARSAGRLGGGE